MTKHELFTRVAAHLLTQRKRSTSYFRGNVEVCAYRGYEGLTCAVGCLIKDDFYTKDLENEPCDGDNVVDALTKSLGFTLEPEHIYLLTELQNVHDDYRPSDWAQKLDAIATKHHLDKT